MNCSRYQDFLMRYFDHDLSKNEWELLDQHLNSCSSCRTLFCDLTGILNVLETAVPVEPQPDLERLVLNRVMSLQVHSDKNLNALLKAIYGSLAGAAILFLFVMSWTLGNTSWFELLLLSRQYLDVFSGIALNLQIIYQMATGLFSPTILSVFRELQAICTFVLFILVFIAVKVALGNPTSQRPDLP